MAKILIIDDDALVCSTIVRILARSGHDLLTAINGRKGLELFERESPDLVITDIIMPDMEGIETIREMRKRAPEVRIIAISGGGRLGNIDFLPMAVKLGAREIITKPFEPSELTDSVSRCLTAAE
jgi:DNA-binding NtrC family response regulator